MDDVERGVVGLPEIPQPQRTESNTSSSVEETDTGASVEVAVPENVSDFRPPLTQNNNTRTAANRRRFNFFLVLYCVPTTIAILVTSVVDYGKPCISPPLRTWVTTQAILQILLLIAHLSLQCCYENDRWRYHRMGSVNQFYFLTRLLNFLWLIWFTVGVAWIFQKHDTNACSDSAPHIYKMSLALIIMEISMLGVSFLICCCSIPLMWIIYLCNPRAFADANQNTQAPRGVDSKVIKANSTQKKYSEASIEKEDANCVICLCDYEPQDDLRFLPCGHHFHSKCIEQWLKSYSKSCPFCKADIDADSTKETVQETV